MAAAGEPFSIRGFAARMRAVDTAKCWPFGGVGDGEAETAPPPKLPPMDPPPRSRWWAHELAALRAAPLGVGAAGEEAALGGGEGGGLRKGTKRKGSRGSGGAERAKKRQRALQFSFFLKNKERISKPQSTSHSLEHVFHKGLFRRRKSCTIHTLRELALRKKLQETQDHMSAYENSLNKQRRGGMEHKRRIKVSKSTTYPLSPGCEVVKHVTYPPKDDIFGDLPLLESSKILFHTGVDILPTVIEDSFVTDQSGPDATSETVPLKLMPASDITKQTSSPLEDLVKKEGNPDKESACISLNDAGRSHSSSVEFDGPQNHRSINIEKTCLAEMELKSTDVPVLSSYFNERPKSWSRNLSQGCFYMNTNYSQEIKEPGTSSAKSSAAMRTRIEATKKDRDAVVNGKKNTDISGRLVPTEYHLSSEGSVLSSAMSQGTVSAGTNTDGISSCKSMPTQDHVPTSSPFVKFLSNACRESRKSVNTRIPLSMEDQGSSYTKLHPVCTPASIGMTFMKLPGLERMEISSCNPRIGENRFFNGQSMNTVRFQKQPLVSGTTNVKHGQSKIGCSYSQAGERGPDGYVRQDMFHPHQSTMRLMGKTVSVCMGSKEQKLSTMGKVWTEHSISGDCSSSISCQLPQKRLYPYQDSVIPRAHVNVSSDILPRIPNSALSEARSTISDVQNQRLHRINSASLTVEDCIWNYGSQFVRQAEVNNTSMVGANSSSRQLEPQQLPKVMSIPQKQHSPLCTSASSMYREDHNFVGSAANQSSPLFPQWVLNTRMQGKYQKSTSLSCENPNSVPIHQPSQVPGAKVSSTSIISFHDYGTINAESRNSYQAVRPSRTTSLASKSISTISPACSGNLSNIDGRKGVDFVDQRNKRPDCADNISQKPTKRQFVTDQLGLTTPMVPNMKNGSLGWSLNDAVGPQLLDFSNKVAGRATQISRNEQSNLRDSSGPVSVVESRSRTVRLVAGDKTIFRPGENMNDHSRLLYSTKFSVDNGINSFVL